MSKTDDWGHDPTVRMMRGIFRGLEDSQEMLLTALNISPFDARLRKWRDLARREFEGSFNRNVRPGRPITEKEASTLYLTGFTKIMSRDGIEIPPNILDSVENGGMD